jgi:hypothetical protein
VADIRDPEVRRPATIAGALAGDYVDLEQENQWAGSPFAWIRSRPSRQKGKIGEEIVAGWAAAKGVAVGRCQGQGADRIIEGRPIEIKFSLLWASDVYVFQQFRDQEYEHAFCLGLSPFTAHAWLVPKQVILDHAPAQHGGRAARDTHWLHLRPAEPPGWLRRYGPTLRRVFQIMSRF